ncbi:uncharacterized protein LOC127862060 [Dreissena polymorpha]|uniref:uncharacterized protein LOC127862060 n=1 Tax=Dreissena polymorpha TaxID=45954 RepID=UPI0022649F15|nr:uncharacterized protein LOC127862060 [Dreissena polymorpha]
MDEFSENVMDNDEDCDVPATQIIDGHILKDVVAYAEVRTGNDNRSESVRRELEQLGATVVRKFEDNVTHVVFKEGSKRTLNKATKKGVHLVSVLWVENCKLNQERVSERMYPAVVPHLKGTPLLMTKLKKAKSMQPLDFEEELANSTERLKRKRKKLEAISKYLSSQDQTPSSARRSNVLVMDTQPRSSEEGFVLTPIRLTIPDTPPSMREKLKKLKLAKQVESGAMFEADIDAETEERQAYLKQLQKNLFFEDPVRDSSIDKDIMQLAENITSTLNDSITSSPGSFEHSSGHSRNSQEINRVAKPRVDYNFMQSENPFSDNIVKHGIGKKKSIDKNIESNDDEVLTIVREKMTTNANGEDRAVKDFSDISPIIPIAGEAGNYSKGRMSSTQIDKKSEPPVSIEGNVSKSEAERHCNAYMSSECAVTESAELSKEKLRRAPRRKSMMETKDKLPDSHAKIKSKNKQQSVEFDDSLERKQNETGVDKGKNDIEIIEIPSKINRRRSTRRMSIKQVVDELDETNLVTASQVDNVDLEPQNNKVAPKPGKSDASKDHKDMSSKADDKLEVDINQTLDVKTKTTTTGKRLISNRSKSSSDLTLETTKKPIKERRSIAVVNSQKVNKDIEAHLTGGPDVSKPGKKTMKRKLMSLTDLNDQHSVLVEPTKCSEVERPQLVPSQGKKGVTKNTKNETKDLNAKRINVSEDLESVANGKTQANRQSKVVSNNIVDKKGKKYEEKTVSISKKQRYTKSMDDVDYGSAKGAKSTNPPRENTSKKKKTLVNDTYIEGDTTSCERNILKPSQITQIQDITTQLNLTKENSLVCSIRETTLSMSMSRAYTDSNMPSVLQPGRKSVNEFNLTKERTKTKGRKQSASKTASESGSNQTSSESDSSGRRGKLNSSGSRKNIRPSIVMTSLHSHEQDVVISVVKKLGGFVISENVNETTTHVICGQPRRTLNVLQCLARGIWLVTKEWVLRSLDKSCWIAEEEFEAHQFFPTCKVSRLERERTSEFYRQTLFSSTGQVYISGRASPPRQQLVQLIKLCGGQVTGQRDKANLYVGGDFHPGLTCVKTSWILDCITAHKLLPLDQYALDRPKRESSPVY